MCTYKNKRAHRIARLLLLCNRPAESSSAAPLDRRNTAAGRLKPCPTILTQCYGKIRALR